MKEQTSKWIRQILVLGASGGAWVTRKRFGQTGHLGWSDKA